MLTQVINVIRVETVKQPYSLKIKTQMFREEIVNYSLPLGYLEVKYCFESSYFFRLINKGLSGV